MKKEKRAACGCWFGLVAITGPILLFISYRVAHRIYDYQDTGGHYFGGVDFAVFDAFTNAIFLGPLIGVAFALLTMVPSEPPRHWRSRVIGAIVLCSLPLITFTLDVRKYRARYIRIKEANQRSIEEFHASKKNRDSEQIAPSDGDKHPK